MGLRTFRQPLKLRLDHKELGRGDEAGDWGGGGHGGLVYQGLRRSSLGTVTYLIRFNPSAKSAVMKRAKNRTPRATSLVEPSSFSGSG